MAIFIPPDCQPLSSIIAKQQIRLGIQGFGGTGKNWSVLGTPDKKQRGFPNPIVLNIDRGLGAHSGCGHINELPFYKLHKRSEMKDKLIEWLDKNASKMSEEQTLIIDNLSSLEQIYHEWYRANEHMFISDKGQVNAFAEWQVKEKWFNQLHLLFHTLCCDVILLAHESERPDKSTTPGQPGQYTGKIRAVVTGKVGDTIIKEYTDWFRQRCCAKTQDPKPETLNGFRMTKDEFISMQRTFEGDTVYFWQTKGDDIFDGKASSLVNPPTFIPATYDSFLKYSRQIKQQ